MNITENFISSYSREYDYYQKVASLCAQQCETRLEQEGIRSMVTYRAKRPDRLREKILKRNPDKQYKTADEILADIVDLAGVRIALYFPSDDKKVRRLIESQFVSREVREFPVSSQSHDRKFKQAYKSRFSGYWATHYRVKLREDSLPAAQAAYAKSLIEIQVASVLMHAWAEVEHDLIYKPRSGNLSLNEYAILDELNGLILSGEIALGRLQEAVKSHEAFGNHYELAAFLYDEVRSALGESVNEPIMGRADVLLRFLHLAELDRPERLKQFVSELNYSELFQRGITEQITDLILQNNPNLYDLSIQAKQEVGPRNPYSSYEEETPSHAEDQAVKYFMSRWVAFETAVRNAWWRVHPDQFTRHTSISGPVLDVVGPLGESDRERIEKIRSMRDELVHGVTFPNYNDLIQAGKYLESLLIKWHSEADNHVRELIARELEKISVKS